MYNSIRNPIINPDIDQKDDARIKHCAKRIINISKGALTDCVKELSVFNNLIAECIKYEKEKYKDYNKNIKSDNS